MAGGEGTRGIRGRRLVMIHPQTEPVRPETTGWGCIINRGGGRGMAGMAGSWPKACDVPSSDEPARREKIQFGVD